MIVPLTPGQRNWLRANAVLPTVFALAVVVTFGVILMIVITRPSLPLFVRGFATVAGLLLVAVCGAVALHVRNNMADALRGTADVATARCTKKYTSGRSPRTLYGDFEGAGTLIIHEQAQWEQLAEGSVYVLTFSPRARRCWDVRRA